MQRIYKAILPQSFILAIVGAVLLAWFLPLREAGEAFRALDKITGYGIALIFFFYGLRLEPQEVRSGIVNYKLHMAVQASTFLLFPTLLLLVYPFVNAGFGFTIWLGFFFLSCLPSTVSSSVVMTSIAGGNIPGAIFNASLSGVIGIVLTPLWMRSFIERSGNASFSGIFLVLAFQVLVPLILGIVLHRPLAGYIRSIRPYLALFDKSVILLIIYKSFCVSFGRGIFQALALTDMLLVLSGVIFLFFTVLFLTWRLAILLGFSREDRIALEFCGTKKSLVHGSVFYALLFAGDPKGGIYLLPIMFYHAFQLFFISWLANRYAQDTK